MTVLVLLGSHDLNFPITMMNYLQTHELARSSCTIIWLIYRLIEHWFISSYRIPRHDAGNLLMLVRRIFGVGEAHVRLLILNLRQAWYDLPAVREA
jgi:hypothetical protein